MTKAIIRAVLAGKCRPLGPTRSAIDKHPLPGPAKVGFLGLLDDEQADLRVHGGEDKALHLYPWSHYAAWRTELADCPLFEKPGAFGENLSLEGLDEHQVCIGDHWRIGNVRAVITQGRQPCFKLNLRFAVRDMAMRVQDSLRAGWYMRVVEPGVISPGDSCELLERPFPAHSVASLLALIRDRETNPERLRPILQLPLPESWRRLFERRLQNGQSEDWSSRINGNV